MGEIPVRERWLEVERPPLPPSRWHDDAPNPKPTASLVALVLIAGSILLLALEASAASVGRVFFIGSSTVERFPLGALFPGKPCTNLGLGNENALQLRERLSHTLPDASPAGIVLYSGGADLRFEPALAAAVIIRRVWAVVSDLRARFPDAQVILVEILPARDQSKAELAAVRDLNSKLEDLARQRGLVFVRTNREPLVDARGDLVESMSADRHHLNLDGYRVLAGWIREDGGAVGEQLR